MWPGSWPGGNRSSMVAARKLRSPSRATRGSHVWAWLCFSPGVEPNSIRLRTRCGDCIARFCATIATGGVADDMCSVAAEMVQQLAHILHQTIHRQRRFGRRHLQFAVAAEIHAHDAIVTAERWHRGVPPLR